MSVVIVGGNERMVCQYEDICKGFGRSHEEKNRCTGSDDPVYQYGFSQNGELCSGGSEEKIHSCMPLSHKQRCSS